MIRGSVGRLIKPAVFKLPSRGFCHTSVCASYIGKALVTVPADVLLTTTAKSLTVKGPLGELTQTFPAYVTIKAIQNDITNGESNENDGSSQATTTVSVSVPNASGDRYQRMMWGTVRSVLANNVEGVTDGHLSILKLVGTGFRANVEDDPQVENSVANGGSGKRIHLKVGFSVPKYVTVPAGIEVTTPVPHRIVITGIDKQQVKLLAANIRKIKKPEPYKGKGIFIDNETITLKAKKIK
ncbi:ribosomal protein L6 [Nadsonia fulvescens var. elongata DSM 6958]|uniref:Ribosomal protein L6 n=1 Tax=Nadsonia fulvescens var. elongata DSM 6958 TaxID=857566 RepID=A0A1E3PD07_9ASCO|nr:ribosomal protein L6 [Nadsonia fulvescens var. elongata DSM 6958]